MLEIKKIKTKVIKLFLIDILEFVIQKDSEFYNLILQSDLIDNLATTLREKLYYYLSENLELLDEGDENGDVQDIFSKCIFIVEDLLGLGNIEEKKLPIYRLFSAFIGKTSAELGFDYETLF